MRQPPAIGCLDHLTTPNFIVIVFHKFEGIQPITGGKISLKSHEIKFYLANLEAFSPLVGQQTMNSKKDN